MSGDHPSGQAPTFDPPPKRSLGARTGSRLVPRRHRQAILGRVAAIVYAGNRFECPCCGGRFRAFRHGGLACPRCGSLQRDRLLTMYFKGNPGLLQPGTRLLHFAPEYSLRRLLRAREGLDYVTADLDSPLADDQVDITRLPYPDASFDATLCSHVLEHVPDDRTAMRELWRVLRPGGWAIVMVPVHRDLETTSEDLTITDPAERERLYGQTDHVRLYGQDLRERLEGAGFSVTLERFLDDLPASTVARFQLREPEGLRQDAGVGEEDNIYLCLRP